MIADRIHAPRASALDVVVGGLRAFFASFGMALEMSRRIESLRAAKGRLDGDDVRRIATEITGGRGRR